MCCTGPGDTPTLPWVKGTENNSVENGPGPRVDTSGCPACQQTEMDAYEAYLTELLHCGSLPSEAWRVNCRTIAWAYYAYGVMYPCFVKAGCIS